MKKTNNAVLPEKCWIFYKGRYILRGIDILDLPYVGLQHELILKYYKIPYRKVTKTNFWCEEVKEVLEYWNPEIGLTEKEISLPIFAQIGTSYRYCEKKRPIKTPTNDCAIAAMQTEKFVKEEILNYEKILREVELYQLAKSCLSGNVAEMFYKLGVYVNPIEDIEMNHDKFKIISLTGTNWVAIFDMNKIVPNSQLFLQVPKDIVGRVIGKGGENIKAWAREIRVRKIQVIPI